MYNNYMYGDPLPNWLSLNPTISLQMVIWDPTNVIPTCDQLWCICIMPHVHSAYDDLYLIGKILFHESNAGVGGLGETFVKQKLSAV